MGQYVTTRIDDVKWEELNIRGAVGVYTQWLIGKNDSSLKYAIRRQVIKPGGKAPLHRHAYSETFIVLKGIGIMRVGDAEFRIRSSMLIHVAPNIPHSLTNLSNEDLEVLSIISQEPDMSIVVLE